MAINMMNEKDYITCPKCRSITLREEEVFTLKKVTTNKITQLKKQIVSKAWICTKCGTSVTDEVKKHEMV